MFFFKNLIFTIPQFFFGFYNGFSGQSIWEDMYITTYNSVMTAFSAAAYATWEKDIEADYEPYEKMVNIFFPYLYRKTQEKEILNKKRFLKWFLVSIAVSLGIFALPMTSA